jgi:hypothetical protein
MIPLSVHYDSAVKDDAFNTARKLIMSDFLPFSRPSMGAEEIARFRTF